MRVFTWLFFAARCEHADYLAKKTEIMEEPFGMGKIVGRVKYFLENLDKLLIQQIDPIKKAQFFRVFFDKIPTYADLKLEMKI